MAERVDAHRIEEQIQATGELIAVDEANVAAEVGGRITAMRVAEGAPGPRATSCSRSTASGASSSSPASARSVAGARSEIAQERASSPGSRACTRARRPRRRSSTGARRALRTAHAELAAAEARARPRAARPARRERRGAVRRARGAPLRLRGRSRAQGEPLFDLVALDPIEVEFHLTERDSRARRGGPPRRGARHAVPGRSVPRHACTWSRRASTRPRARCA